MGLGKSWGRLLPRSLPLKCPCAWSQTAARTLGGVLRTQHLRTKQPSHSGLPVPSVSEGLCGPPQVLEVPWSWRGHRGTFLILTDTAWLSGKLEELHIPPEIIVLELFPEALNARPEMASDLDAWVPSGQMAQRPSPQPRAEPGPAEAPQRNS